MHCTGVVSATAAHAATHRSTFTSLRCTAPAAFCVVPSPPCFLRFPNYLFRKHQFRTRVQIVPDDSFSLHQDDGMEEQVRAIGEEIASLEDGSRTGVQALAECLMFVDLIQRLGIQRNYEELIKKIMKTTYIFLEGRERPPSPSIFPHSISMIPPPFSTISSSQNQAPPPQTPHFDEDLEDHKPPHHFIKKTTSSLTLEYASTTSSFHPLQEVSTNGKLP